MTSPIAKYGFAAVVAGALLLAAGAVAVKGLSTGGKGQAVAARPAGAPGGGGGGGGGEVPIVEAGVVAARGFADTVQALGTAQARESIVVAAKVTDVISAIKFDSGDRVTKGQVLVVLSNVEQEADLAEARAALTSATREYDRFTELGARGFAPKARLEQAQASYEQARARVAALESRMADRTIRAPFAGVMGLRTASPGALVRPGDAIATLDDTSAIKLDFDVPEVHLSRMPRGAELTATTAAYPGQTFSGRIDDVDSRIDPRTRTVKVRAIIANQSGALKPGMLMTVNVAANPRSTIAVPEMAVVETMGGASVFKVVDKDGKTIAKPTDVTLGARAGGYVEVLAGLAAGDRIVTEGVQRARPGQPIRIDAIAPDGAPEKNGAPEKPAATAAGASAGKPTAAASAARL